MLERAVVDPEVFVDPDREVAKALGVLVVVLDVLGSEHGHAVKFVEAGVQAFEGLAAFERRRGGEDGGESVAPAPRPFLQHLLLFEFGARLSAERGEHRAHILALRLVFAELPFDIRHRAHPVFRPGARDGEYVGIADGGAFEVYAVLHDHQHRRLLHLAGVEEGVVLVVFVGGEHALGEQPLELAVEVLPLFGLILLRGLHGALEREIAHLERLSAHDAAKSRVLEVRVDGGEFLFVHAEDGAHLFEGVVLLRSGAKVQPVDIRLELLVVAIGEMLVDEQIVNEGETLHQKITREANDAHCLPSSARGRVSNTIPHARKKINPDGHKNSATQYIR